MQNFHFYEPLCLCGIMIFWEVWIFGATRIIFGPGWSGHGPESFRKVRLVGGPSLRGGARFHGNEGDHNAEVEVQETEILQGA